MYFMGVNSDNPSIALIAPTYNVAVTLKRKNNDKKDYRD
jgi:hypothetical protein